VRWVSVVDGDGRVLAHSEPEQVNTRLASSEQLRVSRTRVPLSSRELHPDLGWVLETVAPLQVGNRRWGAAFIGFDAEPTRARISWLFLLLLTLSIRFIRPKSWRRWDALPQG
jgi:hypothetical protein